VDDLALRENTVAVKLLQEKISSVVALAQKGACLKVLYNAAGLVTNLEAGSVVKLEDAMKQLTEGDTVHQDDRPQLLAALSAMEQDICEIIGKEEGSKLAEAGCHTVIDVALALSVFAGLRSETSARTKTLLTEWVSMSAARGQTILMNSMSFCLASLHLP
jgi:uncharacterized membrane protein YhiD involved in acid resistance